MNKSAGHRFSAPYRKRPIRFLELHEQNGWQFKVYGISASAERPPTTLLAAAKEHLPDWLEEADTPDLTDYGTGLLIVHQANDGNYVLASWWVGENMLRHYVYYSIAAMPSHFERVSDNGLMACVWELEIIDYERRAWVKHILKRPENPDFSGYLNAHLNTEF